MIPFIDHKDKDKELIIYDIKQIINKMSLKIKKLKC